jgi:hypothetical protein
VHCCVVHVAAQLNTESHSGSWVHWRTCEQQDDSRHDVQAVSDALELHVMGRTEVPPLVPLLPPLVVVDPLVPPVPPLVPPRGPPLVPVPLPVVVPLHAVEATTATTHAKNDGKLRLAMDPFF